MSSQTLPVGAALMCHAPIVIPAIAGERFPEVEVTCRSMREVASGLVRSEPEVVVVVSPHTARHPTAFTMLADETVTGDFGRFGYPGIGCRFSPASAFRKSIATAADAARLPVYPVADEPADHGALVPLWFVAEAGWRGPVVVLGFPYRPRLEDCRRLGAALREGLAAHRWALIASGDMSHRLLPDAPAGFDPRAPDFDAEVVAAVRAGDLGRLRAIAPGLRQRAAEDVVDSLETAAGTLGERPADCKVLSYEGPFGVGYLVAWLGGAATAGGMERELS